MKSIFICVIAEACATCEVPRPRNRILVIKCCKVGETPAGMFSLGAGPNQDLDLLAGRHFRCVCE